ncbi:carboxypeptidase-like regulatory domain-containing protein [Pendulispora brunnea]|uniref:Carboxypeptidase-like regulatory domain-containing protein n=1 Tax=Pendulispora brunnea TaxID=2905690 RepID=A0ABZ2KQP1_9BACT
MRPGLVSLPIPESHLGFAISDYSTGRLLGGRVADLLVLVPRRDRAMRRRAQGSIPPPSDKRLFFRTAANATGYVVAFHVPGGVYDVHVSARGYLPFHGTVAAPSESPVNITMYRNVDYPFGPEDTVLIGRVEKASGEPHIGFEVELRDPDPRVPSHRVPLNARGEFTVFIPEKLPPPPNPPLGPPSVAVMYAGGEVLTEVSNFKLNRTNIAPLTKVP